MAAPHSRPLALTQHANRPELVTRQNPWVGEIRVPAPVAALLEIRLGEQGHDLTGLVAHVPHYVAQFDYPLAVLSLLGGVEQATGLRVALDALPRRSRRK